MKRPDECQNMAELRASIDALDDQLIALLAQRASYIERAAALKLREGIAAAVPDRVRAVVARVRKKATGTALSPDLAEKLWREMITFFIAREEELMRKEQR